MSDSNEIIFTYDRLNGHTAFGTVHEFHGPNLPRYTNGVHILQPMNDWATQHFTSEYSDREAQKIVHLLYAAYEAGRQSMQKDIQNLLGLNRR